jgi:predicted Zn-dependent protease
VTDQGKEKETETATEKPARLRRLFQLLAAMVVLWAVVTALRMLRPAAPLTLARQAVESGQFSTAVEHYLRHLERRPEDGGARSELGLVLAQIDRPRALAELRKVSPESEAYWEARRQIVQICLASERLKEAEDVLLELTRHLPDDFASHFSLAELYFRQGRPSAALPLARKSAELDPQHVGAQFLVAELLDDLGRPREMIPPLERVVALQLDHFAAHLNLAYAYAESGEPAKSRREAQWCLARRPDDIHARRLLAQAARDEGQLEEASQEIEKALALAPDDLECRLLEAELLLFEQRPEPALQRLKPLYDRHARDRRLVALLARAAAAAGLDEDAAEYRRQVQQLSK